MGTTSLERNCPRGANSFLKELTPIKKGGKIEYGTIASPENMGIYLKILFFLTGMPPGPPGLMAVPSGFPMMAPVPAPPPREAKHAEDEPPNKKQKTEDQLIPEDEFLRRFKVKLSSRFVGKMRSACIPMWTNFSFRFHFYRFL